jgi:hypothetical protein
MPKLAVTDWNTNADANTDVAGVNIAEGMPPSGVNDAMRAIMAQIASFIAAAAKWLLTTDSTVQDPSGAAHTIGYRNVPFVTPRNASTLALNDMGQAHAFTGGITVPANATVAFPVEAIVTLVNRTAAAQIITPASGVTLRLSGTASSGARSLAPYSSCYLWKVDTDEWWSGGAGLT